MRHFLLALLLLASPSPSLSGIQMQHAIIARKRSTSAGIAYDAEALSDAVFGTDTSTHSHTTGVGSNRCLFVRVNWSGSGITADTVTYNGVSMTKLFERVDSVFSLIHSAGFILAAPASGSHNVVVTWSGNPSVACVGSVSFTGVAQDTPNREPVSDASVDESAPFTGSLTVANALNGDLVIDSFMTTGSVLTASLTSRGEHDNIAGDNKSAGSQTTPATGSTVMTWTSNQAAIWAAGAVALIPAP